MLTGGNFYRHSYHNNPWWREEDPNEFLIDWHVLYHMKKLWSEEEWSMSWGPTIEALLISSISDVFVLELPWIWDWDKSFVMKPSRSPCILMLNEIGKWNTASIVCEIPWRTMRDELPDDSEGQVHFFKQCILKESDDLETKGRNQREEGERMIRWAQRIRANQG